MKLKKIAERGEDFDPEEYAEISPTFYTEAKTEAIQEACKVVAAASIQSGLKFRKISESGSKEILVMDAEDCEATVIQSLTQDFINESEYDYELGSHAHDPEMLFVVADLPEELRSKPEDEEDGEN